MRTLLLIVSIFLVGSISAQNWVPIKNGEVDNFNASDIHSLRIDSSNTIGNSTYYYSNRIINDTVYNNYFFNIADTIKDLTVPNFLGAVIESTPNGLIFKNHKGILQLVQHKARIFDQWTFYTDSNYVIMAKIDTAYVDIINNNPDSVKQLSFKAFDHNSNPIYHPVNNQEILLSKNFGFIKTFSLYQFPDTLNLIEFERVFVNISKTNREMFDYDSSDVIHIVKTDEKSTTPLNIVDYSNHTILKKRLSSNNDTVFYNKDIKHHIITPQLVSPTGPLIFVNTYPSHNKNFRYTDLSSLYTEAIGKTPNIKYDSINKDLYAEEYQFSTDNYNGRLKIKHNNTFFFDTTSGSWITAAIQDHEVVIEGVFHYTNQFRSFGGSNSQQIKYFIEYFKKGNETWGTQNIITGLNQLENIEQAEEISIFPNPANNRISITTKQEFKKLDYQVRSIKGQLIDTGQLNPNSSLNTSHLADGIYFLLLQSENFKETKKLIIQQ